MDSGEKESDARSEARSGWINDAEILGGLGGSLSVGTGDGVVVMVEYEGY